MSKSKGRMTIPLSEIPGILEKEEVSPKMVRLADRTARQYPSALVPVARMGKIVVAASNGEKGRLYQLLSEKFGPGKSHLSGKREGVIRRSSNRGGRRAANHHFASREIRPGRWRPLSESEKNGCR